MYLLLGNNEKFKDFDIALFQKMVRSGAAHLPSFMTHPPFHENYPLSFMKSNPPFVLYILGAVHKLRHTVRGEETSQICDKM